MATALFSSHNYYEVEQRTVKTTMLFRGLMMLYCSAAFQALMRSPSLTAFDRLWGYGVNGSVGPFAPNAYEKFTPKIF